jgi:hypothetical protein
MSDNPTPQQPRGEPLNISDDELDKLAQITPADIAAMRAKARQVPDMRKMIEARPTEAGEE